MLAQGERLAEMKTVNGSLYCFIVSYLNIGSAELQYAYVKDMRSLSDFKENVISAFVTVGVLASLILAGIMLLLLIGLTRPFRMLGTAAAEISEGRYAKRVAIKSRDEIGEFAKSFNRMAERVGEHIAELSRMAESRQNFIDSLAHEIRTPITSIVGYGELLQCANCTGAERETAIRHIIGQGRRIQNMSHKLLDLSYMRNADIQMSPVRLGDVFANAITAANSNLTKKNMTVGVDAEPVAIRGDAELLESLFVNLIDNAIDASDNGSGIEIRARNVSQGISVEISDRGKGIEREEILRITEPFYRIDKSRSGAGNHAGLGLALCARICEIHNAGFEIFSELGRCTTIKILFTAP
jgi:signal transduction histidine kinase